MTTQLETLLAGGEGYEVSRSGGGASFRPSGSSPAELDAFQRIADELVGNDGRGYEIFKDNFSSDHGHRLYDLIMVTFPTA
ncbi:hypothetical protein U1707_07840 [Sphingomonas sp. PB2P12]|uniref:hypothetical protein n=1 Tax=Sphingomonas sandaracina TaxID=3096157 RepID=UPI002FC9CE59